MAELWQFTPARLCDSIENHMGQKGDPWVFILPKRSKIGQKMAELWQFYPARLHDSIEDHMGHMSPIYRKSTLARLPSEKSAVVCLGFAQTEVVGLSPLLHLN